MVDTGRGGVAANSHANTGTAVNFPNSPKSVNPSTKKTNSLTADQALEILQQSVINCQHAGIDAKVTTFYQHGVKSVIVVLANTELIDGNIVRVEP
jgi:hypothetical protein